MTIAYPLSVPDKTKIKRVTLTADVRVGVLESPWTFAAQVQALQGQRFVAEVTLCSMARPDAEKWIAWVAKLNGRQGTFYLGDPTARNPRGSNPGQVHLLTGNKGDQSIVIEGYMANAQGVLLAGDYITIGNYLYKVLDDVNMNASSQASIDVWPAMRYSYPTGFSIQVVDTFSTFRLVTNTNILHATAEDLISEVSFTCTEAL